MNSRLIAILSVTTIALLLTARQQAGGFHAQLLREPTSSRGGLAGPPGRCSFRLGLEGTPSPSRRLLLAELRRTGMARDARVPRCSEQ